MAEWRNVLMHVQDARCYDNERGIFPFYSWRRVLWKLYIRRLDTRSVALKDECCSGSFRGISLRFFSRIQDYCILSKEMPPG